MLVVNVTYTLKEGMRERFLQAVVSPQVMGECRQEAGNLQYDYFLQADDPDKVLLVEKWVDRDAQKLHQTQRHMALIRAAKDQFVVDTRLEFFDAE